jgi:hypothetical protein
MNHEDCPIRIARALRGPDMLFLFLSMALTSTQQMQHDITEWKMYQQMQGDEEAIADIWRPSATLLADYREVKKCYVRFHLYRVSGCTAELHKVEIDLGNQDTARTETR